MRRVGDVVAFGLIFFAQALAAMLLAAGGSWLMRR
jgi:uncharacterized membrane protein